MEKPDPFHLAAAASGNDPIDRLYGFARGLASSGQSERALELADLVHQLVQQMPSNAAPWVTAPQRKLHTDALAGSTQRDTAEMPIPSATSDDGFDTRERFLSPSTADPTAIDPAEKQRHNAIDAAHFSGLAALYIERGENGAALECIQLAKEKCPALPQPYKLFGMILARQHSWEAASRELALAARYDPFDSAVAELMGRVDYERKDFRAALASTIDAYLLLHNVHSELASQLRRRIRTLKRVLKWESHELIRLFHQRRERLMTAFERLQWRRDLFLQEKGLLDADAFGPNSFPDQAPRIELAGRLRHVRLLSQLKDEEIFQLTQVAHQESYDADRELFCRGDGGSDLFFVERGEISLHRDTPHGTFEVHRVSPGELIGEVGFLTQEGRSTDATTALPTRVLRIDGEGLRRLFDENVELAAQVYSSLWHTLADKLRGANGRLASFFEASDDRHRDEIRVLPSFSTNPTVDLKQKLELFSEQGLNHRELLTMATFARELQIPSGTFLFREGDPGKELFIVLEGRIRISKVIPGGGEEALEIVSRGGFFGEVAMIDGQPRSADARAHDGPATVLSLDRETVREVLSMDPHASVEFMRLLCRLLASRLRELDEKLVLWRILSATGPEPPRQSTGTPA